MTTNTQPLEPIDFQSMHEQVYLQLRSALMRGSFEPGQQLSGRKIGKALGTSEMPVRAAFSRLLTEKALVKRSNSTFAVPVLNRQLFIEIMELRVILEREATLNAARHIDRLGLDEVRASNEGLERALEKGDLDNYLDFHRSLKLGIYRYCSSATLRSHIELLWLQCGPFLRHLDVGSSHPRPQSFCRRIVDSLEQGDGQAAAEAVVNDIQSGLNYLLKYGKFSSE